MFFPFVRTREWNNFGPTNSNSNSNSSQLTSPDGQFWPASYDSNSEPYMQENQPTNTVTQLQKPKLKGCMKLAGLFVWLEFSLSWTSMVPCRVAKVHFRFLHIIKTRTKLQGCFYLVGPCSPYKYGIDRTFIATIWIGWKTNSWSTICLAKSWKGLCNDGYYCFVIIRNNLFTFSYHLSQNM